MVTTKLTKTCPICEKSFTTYQSQNHKTCSAECGRALRSQRRLIICARCGKQFERSHTTQRFCSPECAGTARKQPRTKLCPECGKPIPYKLCRAAKQKHCSRKCAATAEKRRYRQEAECLWCKTVFTARTREILNGRRFCSVNCSILWRIAERHGYSEPQRQALREHRNSHQAAATIAIQLMGNRCAVCGWDQAPCDVHHIIPKRRKGTHKLNNLIILCPNHHRMATKGLLSSTQLLEAWQLAYASLQLEQSLVN